jgi:hypothetical protein
MHYIIGTTLIKSSKQLSLYNIVRKDGKLLYTFMDTNGDATELQFESTKQADTFIARARNEQLPDYLDFYKKSN